MASILVDEFNYTFQEVRKMNYQDYVVETCQAIEKRRIALSKLPKNKH